MESHKLPDVKKKIVMKSWVIGQKESTNHKSRITNFEGQMIPLSPLILTFPFFVYPKTEGRRKLMVSVWMGYG